MRLLKIVVILILNACATNNVKGPSEIPPLFIVASGHGDTNNLAIEDAKKNALKIAKSISTVAFTSQEADYFLRSLAVDTSRQLHSGVYDVKIKSYIYRFPKFPNSELELTDPIKSTLNRKKVGDLLLANLVSNYPNNALKAEMGMPKFSIDKERVIHAKFPYTISWNDGYLGLFHAVIKYISNDNSCFDLQLNKPSAYSSNCRDYDIHIAGDIDGVGDIQFPISSSRGYRLDDNEHKKFLKANMNNKVGLLIEFFDKAEISKNQTCVIVDLEEQSMVTANAGSLDFYKIYYKNQVDIRLANQDLIDTFHHATAKLINQCKAY